MTKPLRVSFKRIRRYHKFRPGAHSSRTRVLKESGVQVELFSGTWPRDFGFEAGREMLITIPSYGIVVAQVLEPGEREELEKRFRAEGWIEPRPQPVNAAAKAKR